MTFRQDLSSRLAQTARQVFWCLFLLTFVVVWTGLWLPLLPEIKGQWLDGLLLILALAATLTQLARELPGQNVLQAAIIISASSTLVQILGSWTGFKPECFAIQNTIDSSRWSYWAGPMLWIVLMLTSRGTARLILSRWRTHPNYGYRLLGSTVGLMLLMELGLQVFATQVRAYWTWAPFGGQRGWHSSLCHFVGFTLIAFFILLAVTPVLIDKKPHPPQPQSSGADGRLLALWLMVSVLFLTSLALHQVWFAAGLTGIGAVVVVLLYLRSAQSP